MYELIYTSAETQAFSPPDLAAMLRVARTNNTAAHVTGILLYHQGSFMQVLEGEQSSVQSIYAKVCKDKRHYRIRVLREGAIEARRFSDWSMGFVTLDPALVRGLEGRHPLISNGSMVDDANSVLELLDQFRSGQFRRYVNG